MDMDMCREGSRSAIHCSVQLYISELPLLIHVACRPLLAVSHQQSVITDPPQCLRRYMKMLPLTRRSLVERGPTDWYACAPTGGSGKANRDDSNAKSSLA